VVHFLGRRAGRCGAEAEADGGECSDAEDDAERADELCPGSIGQLTDAVVVDNGLPSGRESGDVAASGATT
jgi:hypothetical protein